MLDDSIQLPGAALSLVGRLERGFREAGAWIAARVTPERSGAGLKVLILLQILLVLSTALRHEPWYAFEESTTLRVASLSPEDMAEVLAEDQNYPVYYRILHELGRIFDPDKAAIAFNFASWILSLLVFHLLARELLGRSPWALLATLVFAATPSILQYAFYVRMYAQLNLLLLIALLALVRYANRGGGAYLVLAGLALMGGSLFHPVGGLCAVLYFLAAIPVARGARDRALVAAFAGSAALVALLEALGKNDFRRLYLGSGIQYVRELSTPLHTFTGLVLGRTEGAYSWVYFLLGAILLCLFFARTPLLRRVYYPLAVFAGTFILLHFILDSYANAHHYYFFTAPLILAFVVGLAQATKRSSRWTWLALALPAVFLQGSFTYCREADRAVRTSDALGGTMARLPQGAVVSDFIVHDMVARAIPPGSHRTFILSEDSLIETTGLALKEVLLIQSRLGGRPGSGIATRAYASGISRALASEGSPLKRQAAELTAGTPSIFLVLPLNRTSLFPAELELFKTAPFREFIRPTLYRFSASDP